MLYNAQLLEWHPGHTGADVLFVDYDNVESVGLDDMYTNFRSELYPDLYSDYMQLQ